MPNILTKNFHTGRAKDFIDEIQLQKSNFYYFLGGITPWNDNPNFDEVPDIDIEDTYANKIDMRQSMVFAKKILPNDASMMIPKVEWMPDEIYAQWDDSEDMSGQNFYVLTSDMNVYKCLNNNSGNPSTQEPITTSVEPIKMSDGYIWKYMYNISPFRQKQFQHNEYMPVQRAMSDTFFNDGQITNVIINDMGEGYTSNPQTLIEVVDDGYTTGIGATATLTITDGSIIDATITNTGSGYTHGVNLVIDDVAGRGAILEPEITAGEITGINIVEPGFNYTEDTTITFEVGGANLFPVVSRDGEIVDVKIINDGIGYDTTPPLNVISVDGTGTGKYDNATAQLSCVIYEGSIKQVNILDPGQNYVVDTDTTITVTGNGEGARLFPVVYEGKVIDVIIDDPGKFYSDAILTVYSASGDGSGASIQPVLSNNDYESDQSIIEQNSAKGIYAIVMENKGSGYNTTTCTIEIRGNGNGCTGIPIIGFGGRIDAIEITNYGEDYTWAEVIITDPRRGELENDDAVARVIIPPYYGHGYNAPEELLSTQVAIISSLRNDLEIQEVTQDYRLFGILKDPKELLTNHLFDGQSTVFTYTCDFNNVTDLELDETLIFKDSGKINRFKVFFIREDGTVCLLPIDRQRIVPSGLLLSEDETREYISTVKSSPDFDKYSGNLIYASAVNPFTFSTQQSLSLKTFIQF